MAAKKRKSSLPRGDFNESAFAAIYGRSDDPRVSTTPRRKNPQAVQLGRLGGIASAKVRGEKIPAEKRREIAQAAARARWAKRKP